MKRKDERKVKNMKFVKIRGTADLEPRQSSTNSKLFFPENTS